MHMTGLILAEQDLFTVQAADGTKIELNFMLEIVMGSLQDDQFTIVHRARSKNIGKDYFLSLVCTRW